MSHIVLGISSGIAAYKVLELVTKLRQEGHKVTVILTKSAESMIRQEEVEKVSDGPVYTTLFPSDFDHKKILKDRVVDHIEAAKKADIFVVAPATANTIAKISTGIADDFLTTTLLATLAPVLICPSMNTNMWNHEAVQENVSKLKKRGYYILYPESGELACGTEGVGRLTAIESIQAEITTILTTSNTLSGNKIIVTTGGTQEPIDDVRVITNKSSGKMGLALAEECFRQGADVLLLRSQSSVETNLPIKQETFVTASDLESLIHKHIHDYNVIFQVAAISDFVPQKTTGKIESNDSLTLHLKPNKKIIDEIKKWSPKITLIGFKAVSNLTESELTKKALTTLKKSQADYIIANDVGKEGIGFHSDFNEVIIFSQTGKVKKLKKTLKKQLAREILQNINW